MPEILEPATPSPDIESPDHDCPQCASGLEPEFEFDGTVKFECEADDCDYFEITGDLPVITSYLGRIRKVILQIFWPYPELLGKLQAVIGGLLVVVSASLYVATVLHELGHGIAYRLYGHRVERFQISAFLGLFPLAGFTEPDVEPSGDRGLRAALHVTVGGITFNILSSLLAVPVLIATLPPGGLSGSSGFVFNAAMLFFGVNVLSVGNIFPFPGADGDHLQHHVLQVLADRLGIEDSVTVAHYASRTVFYGFLTAFVYGVISG
jgi:hypothetical protein